VLPFNVQLKLNTIEYEHLLEQVGQKRVSISDYVNELLDEYFETHETKFTKKFTVNTKTAKVAGNSRRKEAKRKTKKK